MEDVVHVGVFLYDIDTVDGAMLGELAKGVKGKYSNTLRLLLYNGHICFDSELNVHLFF